MPAGFQQFDGSGNLILDITDNTSKYLGSVSIAASGGSNQTGTVTNSAFTAGTLWWLTTLAPAVNYSQDLFVSVSGSTLTWTAGPSTPACTLFYGII